MLQIGQGMHEAVVRDHWTTAKLIICIVTAEGAIFKYIDIYINIYINIFFVELCVLKRFS